MMNKIAFFVLFFWSSFALNAQELIVNVTISTPRLQLVEPRVFETLKNTMEEAMNNQKWTEDEFEQEERIQVDISMTIREELTATAFKADFNVQATRPIYGTNQKTPLITHVDKNFAFEYEQFQPIEFSENSFTTNLASLLSFYAYTVIGMDYDSFSPYGGEEYFQLAQNIINNIPQNLNETLRKGWRSIDGNRNRYWLNENLLSPKMRGFRQAWYDYHRQALDMMYSDVATGRGIMTGCIETLGAANRNYPNAMILQVFSNTKASELVEIYKQGTTKEQNTIIQTMTRIDAANASKYRAIK